MRLGFLKYPALLHVSIRRTMQLKLGRVSLVPFGGDKGIIGHEMQVEGNLLQSPQKLMCKRTAFVLQALARRVPDICGTPLIRSQPVRSFVRPPVA